MNNKASTGICSVDKCIAQEFRDNYPNYSFSMVGYSVSPRELNRQYHELVDVSSDRDHSGLTETHYCKACKKMIYEKTHR